MKILVVIPAFNEAKRISRVLSDVKKEGFNFIVVDDGSKDKTWLVAEKYTPFVFRHPINLGKGAALKTGCEAGFKMGADAIIIMDSDGQHKASDLNKFAKALRNNDIVFGARDFGKIPFIRLLGNRLITTVVRLLFGIRVRDILCGFKAFTKKAYRKINWNSIGYSVETEIVAMTGQNKLANCEVSIATVYYDKFKGLTVEQGIGIVFDTIRFKLK